MDEYHSPPRPAAFRPALDFEDAALESPEQDAVVATEFLHARTLPRSG